MTVHWMMDENAALEESTTDLYGLAGSYEKPLDSKVILTLRRQ